MITSTHKESTSMADTAPNSAPSTPPTGPTAPEGGLLPGLIVTVTKGADPSGHESR
jgi:hypothetical protein